MKGNRLITLENAKEILKEYWETILLFHQKAESVPLWEAGGRVLAEDITASEDVPSFDRSPVDGYALLSADTRDAAEDNPVVLEIIDTVAAGSYPFKRLVPGTAIKIFTGAPLPREADCVIKKEEAAEMIVDSGSTVIIKRPLSAGENVSFKGEDISIGEVLFFRGSILSPTHMGVLATLGIDPVPVFKKPQIGVFSTGNELVDLHERVQHGQLRASNLYTLAEIIRQAGGIPVNLGLARDRVTDIKQIYEKAYQQNLPLVISTGGTASGDFDVIKDAMEATSSTRLFNKIAIRPGAPFVASVKGKQLLVGLSGNPAGAIVAMYLFLYPMISRLAGAEKQLQPGQAKLTHPIDRHGGLRGFFWGRYEQREQLYVTPLDKQFCSAIRTHANSNCLIEVPAGKVNLDVNDVVDIIKLP